MSDLLTRLSGMLGALHWRTRLHVRALKPPVNTNALARPLAHLVAGSNQILVTRWGLSST